MPAGTKKPSEQQDPYSNDPKHDNPPPEHKGGRQADHQNGPESQKDSRNKQGHPGRKPDHRQPNNQ
jgi:hypothetical protein